MTKSGKSSKADDKRDRYLEINLAYFTPGDPADLTKVVAKRFAPLFAQADGERGLVVNCFWLLDLALLYGGDPAQQLPFDTRRAADWERATYADLRALIAKLRASFAEAGITDLKIGPMFVGWSDFDWGDDLYDIKSAWSLRHPEIYGAGKCLDHRKRLAADASRYASRPRGIREGEAFGEFAGAQWAALAPAMGFDLILLRDAFLGPAIYERTGPFGARGPSSEAEARSASAALTGFFGAIKRAYPSATVMAYSSGRSAIGELRIGCFDLEELVAVGAIDVWIEQTWGGAWEDWWSQALRGWTLQLANLLVHLAMFERGRRRSGRNCRFYHLIETWDGWEPWDTLHGFPDKLCWAVWAYSHASVQTPTGLVHSDGAYVSWASNSEGRLLSEADVAFLTRHIGAADASVAGLQAIHGPALVYDRAALDRLSAERPGTGYGEWLDDQAGMLMKWGVPILSAADGELVPGAVDLSDGAILQFGGEAVPCAYAKDLPILITGAAERIPGAWLDRLGCELDGPARGPGHYRLDIDRRYWDVHRFDYSHFDHHSRIRLSTGRAHVRAGDIPILVESPDGQTVFWHAPDTARPEESYLRGCQFGAVGPFVAAAEVYSQCLRRAGVVNAELAALAGPVAVHSWRSGGRVHILVGNLESGILGDSRYPRSVTVRLQRDRYELPATARLVLRHLYTEACYPTTGNADGELSCELVIAPHGMDVFTVERMDPGGASRTLTKEIVRRRHQ